MIYHTKLLYRQFNKHSQEKKETRHCSVWLLSDVQIFLYLHWHKWYKMICKPISYWSYTVYCIMCWKFHRYLLNFNWFITGKDWTWKYKDSCMPHFYCLGVYIDVVTKLAMCDISSESLFLKLSFGILFHLLP